MITKTKVFLGGISGSFIEISEILRFSDGRYQSLLSINSGEFSCSNHPFYFNDLESFTKSVLQAYDKIEGNASLGDVYEEEFIEISVDKRGIIEVSGFIVDYKEPRQEMHFAFKSDQTFLPELLGTLTQVSNELVGS
jgi:hypothetical protein